MINEILKDRVYELDLKVKVLEIKLAEGKLN